VVPPLRVSALDRAIPYRASCKQSAVAKIMGRADGGILGYSAGGASEPSMKRRMAVNHGGHVVAILRCLENAVKLTESVSGFPIGSYRTRLASLDGRIFTPLGRDAGQSSSAIQCVTLARRDSECASRGRPQLKGGSLKMRVWFGTLRRNGLVRRSHWEDGVNIASRISQAGGRMP